MSDIVPKVSDYRFNAERNQWEVDVTHIDADSGSPIGVPTTIGNPRQYNLPDPGYHDGSFSVVQALGGGVTGAQYG
jgi:hypothetical protein